MAFTLKRFTIKRNGKRKEKEKSIKTKQNFKI
jgi:hypothetical protein